jgi:hypothetical protein
MSPTGIDIVTSLAHRRGDAVHVSLQLPEVTAASEHVTVEAISARRTVRAPGKLLPSGNGALLEAELPTGELRSLVWNLGYRSDEGEEVRLDAHLVAAPGHPVALLLGRARPALQGPRRKAPGRPGAPEPTRDKVVRMVRERDLRGLARGAARRVRAGVTRRR